MAPAQSLEPYVPPRYTIDLSLPARMRYQALASLYRKEITNLTGLFDQLLLDLRLPPRVIPFVNHLSRLTLRRVYDKEQTKELQGISEITGVSKYLLVAFNVVLDLLMGCTSGAVQTLEKGRPRNEAKMLHFRTLDWSMDPLRSIIVHLDFVRSRSAQPDTVVASTITYVGFLGVLTGVRKGLSMSLNFRALHDADTRREHFRFYFHHLLVLFGLRPSIATLLRRHLLSTHDGDSSNGERLADVVKSLSGRHTTAAYLIFSDGETTMTMEKDYADAKIRSSNTFIAITNHDVLNHGAAASEAATPALDAAQAPKIRQNIHAGIEDLILESEDRLKCLQKKWNRRVGAVKRSNRAKTGGASMDEIEQSVFLTRTQVIEWLCDWPTTNECTHYAAVLDPKLGQIAWAQAYPVSLYEEEVKNLQG